MYCSNRTLFLYAHLSPFSGSLTFIGWTVFLTTKVLKTLCYFVLYPCDVFRGSKAKPEGDPLLARLPVVVCQAAHNEGEVRMSQAENTHNTKQKTHHN